MKQMPRIVLIAALLITMLSWIDPPVNRKAKIYTSWYENVLGTSFEFKVKALSEKQAEAAEAAALHEIERLQKILSGYDKESEFSKWVRTQQTPVKISTELMEVLQLFEAWKIKTNGALDASAQVIGNLWKEAEKKQQLPSEKELNDAIAAVNQLHWTLNVKEGTATHTSNAPLMLNSFAKSYIIRKAADAAMKLNEVSGVLVNIGGDIVTAGEVNETVRISNPRADAENDLPLANVQVQNKAIATSGNYRRGENINGKWYSHIVDPRTGKPAESIISATVISPSATDAGALATAFNIVTPAEAAKMAAAVPGTEYMLVTKDGEQITSNGWAAAVIKEKTAIANPEQANSDMELTINLELAQQQGFARRPFVAIWITDKDKNTVRNLAVWYNKERWLHELRAWYSTNGSKFSGDLSPMSPISSATRSAGKYSIKWDGKDDKGTIVKAGKYTINIEAVREHGGYDLINQEINISGKAQQASQKGKAELGEVSFDYHSKAAN